MVQRVEKYQPRNGVKTPGQESSRGSGNTICSESKACRRAKREKEEVWQQSMKTTADVARKIKAKGRMGAKNIWWFSELLAGDCKNAWFHPECEDTMRQWYNWLNEMKDEEKSMEAEHQTFVSRMTASADGGASLLHKITKPTAWRGGVQILKEEEEDATSEEKRKKWAKHWHCGAKVQDLRDKPWRNG